MKFNGIDIEFEYINPDIEFEKRKFEYRNRIEFDIWEIE